VKTIHGKRASPKNSVRVVYDDNEMMTWREATKKYNTQGQSSTTGSYNSKTDSNSKYEFFKEK